MRGRTPCAVVRQRSRCNGEPNKSTITIHEHEFYGNPEFWTLLKVVRALGLMPGDEWLQKIECQR
jgi:hypothetical protein